MRLSVCSLRLILALTISYSSVYAGESAPATQLHSTQRDGGDDSELITPDDEGVNKCKEKAEEIIKKTFEDTIESKSGNNYTTTKLIDGEDTAVSQLKKSMGMGETGTYHYSMSFEFTPTDEQLRSINKKIPRASRWFLDGEGKVKVRCLVTLNSKEKVTADKVCNNPRFLTPGCIQERQFTYRY